MLGHPLVFPPAPSATCILSTTTEGVPTSLHVTSTQVLTTLSNGRLSIISLDQLRHRASVGPGDEGAGSSKISPTGLWTLAAHPSGLWFVVGGMGGFLERCVLADGVGSARIERRMVFAGLAEQESTRVLRIFPAALLGGQRADLVLSAGRSGEVRIWDSSCGRCLAVLEGMAGMVRCGGLFEWEGGDPHASVRKVVAAGHEGVIRVWGLKDLSAGGESETALAIGPERELRCNGIVFALSLDSIRGRLISAGADGELRVWDVRAGTCLADLSGSNKALISRLQLLPDNTLIAGDASGGISIWDLDTFEQKMAICAHGSAAVVSMACLKEQRWLLTGGSDGMIRLWDIASGALIKEFLAEDAASAVWQVGLTEENDIVALFEKDGKVVLGIWDSQPE
ncbi:hypothetical protein BP6252_02398 [Coleophoma cylindrospora]|uniref:Uncharacterized protein n=1 Tax=Coleophoma cylindrospora TaxID=1849047 RepID=A0A3D8SGC0_9HELO|nr:hypothetical protein BP6252_02398 [Coleophoma cylindrospora]